jgi:hypothetical protein
VPERLMRRLKAQAAVHRWSVNLEVIACLEGATQAVPVDADSWLARARAVRGTPTEFRLTDRTLAALRKVGRA